MIVPFLVERHSELVSVLNTLSPIPVEPPFLRCLIVGFTKQKGRMQNIGSKRKPQEKTTRVQNKSQSQLYNSEPLCAVSLALNSPVTVTIERHATRLRYFSLKSDYRVITIIIVSLARRFVGDW
jgi:hypothetical protein